MNIVISFIDKYNIFPMSYPLSYKQQYGMENCLKNDQTVS